MNRNELFKDALKENDKMISGICYRFFGPGDDAGDAHQEILLKIWMNIEKFRNECSIKTWIYRIAVNVCITYRSKAKRKSVRFVPISKSVEKQGNSDYENSGDDENKLVFFRSFVDKLNAADKTLVSLYLEELDTREISEITGFSESNVRVKIHRIKNQIKKEWMAEYGT